MYRLLLSSGEDAHLLVGIRQLITSLNQALHEALLPLLQGCLKGCTPFWRRCRLLGPPDYCWWTVTAG